MVFIGWCYSALNASTFLWAFLQDSGVLVKKYGHLLSEPMWLTRDGRLPKFVGTEYVNLFNFGIYEFNKSFRLHWYFHLLSQ